MSENESPDAEASQHPRPDDWAVDRGRDHALTGEEIELPGAEYGDAADIVGLSSVPVVTGEIEAVSVGARRSSNPNVGPLQPKIEDRISTGEIPVAPVPSASEIPVVPAPGAGADSEPDAGPRDSGVSGRDPSAASALEAGAASEAAQEQKEAPEGTVKGAGAEGRSGDSSGLGGPVPSDGPSKEPGSAHSPGPGAPDASPDGVDEGPAPTPAPEAPSGSAPAPKAESAPSPEPAPNADAPDPADAAFPPPSPSDTRSTQDTIISDHPLVPRSAAEAGKGRDAGKDTGAAEAPGTVKGAGGAEPEDAPPAPATGGSDHDGAGNAPKGTPDSSAPATEPPAAPRRVDDAPAPAPQPPAPAPSADGEPPEPPRSAAQPPAAPEGADSPAPTTEPSAGADRAPAPAAQPPAASEGADEAPSPHGRARHGIPLPEEHAGAQRPKRRSWLFSSRAAQEPPAPEEAEHAAGERAGDRAEEPPAPPLPEQPEVPEPPVGTGPAEPPRADSDGAPSAPESERAGERAEEPPAPPLPEGPKSAEKPKDEHREEPPSAAEDAPSASPSPWSVLPPGAPRRSRRRGVSEAPAKDSEESSATAAPDADAESPRAPGGAGRNKPPTPPATRMSRRARLGWDRPAPAPADEEPPEAVATEPSVPRPESASALRFPAAPADEPAAPAEEPPSTARRPPLETRKSRRARLGWDQPAPAPRPAPEPAAEEPAVSEEKSAYPTAAYSDEIRYPTAYSAGAAYPGARSDEDSAQADDATGTAEDTDFRGGAGADDSRSAHSSWPSSPLPVAGSPGGQSSSWNDEMTRTYWHSPEEVESEPVRAEPDIDETGVIAPTRRSLLSSDEEEPPAPTPEKAEEEAEEFEESPRAASLDDAIFEGTTVKAELPNRSRAHWVGLVAFAIGVPLAWFLAADAGARMTLADNAPMVTGTASFLALGELLGALAFSVLLIASARQSSLGAWAVGGLFTLIGLPWVLVPGLTATAMFPVMSALQSSGAVGANLQHHLQASGYSGRLLLIGVVLIGLGYVSHTTRRIGRAEEARRAEVERVNPSGAHFTSRERRRAHRAEGKR
ncbi:hypothetical protein [Schaalia georgiae]|uniref:hypothetical protein n=1 Tax=Schaalia georgiae TaxID=52768 RepID=UPI0004077A50|nr:hypothetical protein [Schaalia georgiae]